MDRISYFPGIFSLKTRFCHSPNVLGSRGCSTGNRFDRDFGFRVEHPRDPRTFGEWQNRVFHEEHSRGDEIRWLEEEGPLAPALIRELERRDREFDYFVFFSYRYYHSYMGIQRFPRKSILVPTAEHDQVIYLRLFRSFFRLPAAIVYNSPEERELIGRLADNSDVPGDVVGVGSDIPARFIRM